MGFFDRFRRSSKPEPEPEKPSPRSSGSGQSSLGAGKLTRGSSGAGSQPDQELLDAIAAIWDGKESGLGSAPETTSSDREPSANSSSDQEVDLAKTLSLLMGEKPESEEEDDESESTYEQDVNDAIDSVVGLMGALNPDLRDRIRQYAEETQGQGQEPASEPAPEPEPEPEAASESGPDQDLLASIASLMGQGSSDSKPADEAAPAKDDNTDDLLSSISSLIGQGPAEPEPEPKASQDPEPASDDNPFSAIAALMEQDASDPEPMDEPEPAADANSGEDLLSSIAALMGGSMYASDQSKDETHTAPEIDPALEERFESLCAEADRSFDRGALADALATYLQACSVCEESSALKGMAYHHAAAFALHHVGDGFSAAEYSRESLECGEAFRVYAQEHMVEGQPNAYMEALQIAAMTATSYDEALEFADRGVELYGDAFGSMTDELRKYRVEHPRFADYQRNESLKYYSRVSAEEDKGDYAPAMALMDIILRNAKEDAYRLSYEEQAQILDDYGTITIMHVLGKARASGLSQDDFAEGLSFIADGALFRLADFMPECQPADKQRFDRIIQGMKMLPGVSNRITFIPFR